MKSYIPIPIPNYRRKHHFQLLEVMIAIFILLICAAPTLRIYTNMYLEQQAIVRKNQCDHLAHLVHAKITEQLYKRKIPLEEIVQKQLIPLTDPEFKELKEKLSQCSYECSYIFSDVRSYTPRGQEKPTMYLCQLDIKIKDRLAKPCEGRVENEDPAEKIYDYLVYIDSGSLDKHEDNQKILELEAKQKAQEEKVNLLPPANDSPPQPARKKGKAGSQ